MQILNIKMFPFFFFVLSEDLDLRKQKVLPLFVSHISLILIFIVHGTIRVRKPSATVYSADSV